MFYILFFFSALTGSQHVMHQNTTANMPTALGTPTQLADNFFVYSNAVARFVAAQPTPYTAPGANNTVPDASLAFPVWHVRDARWTNTVVNGVVTIYAVAPIAGIDMSAELATRTDYGFSAGITLASRELVSAVHGPTGVFVPAAVPVGVPAFQMRML